MKRTKTQNRECTKVTDWAVSNCADREWGVTANVTINGITFYGCRVIEGKEGKFDDFISFPSRKGTDGEYHAVCNIKLDKELEKEILDAIEKEINA